MSSGEEWVEYELGEICRLRGGSAFKPALQGRQVGHFPFIKVSDFNLPGNEAAIQRANHWVSYVDQPSIQGKPFPRGSVVFAKIGEALKANRKRYLTVDTYIDNNLMGAIPNEKVVVPEFLFQLFRTVDIAASDVGTAVPYVKASTIEKISVRLPTLEAQSLIAGILKAYDDLIDVNQRRVAVLEKMARGLFEEWFIRFRFPGHQLGYSRDTPGGSLPERWRWGTAADAIAFDPKTKVAKDGRKPFFSMGQLDTATSLIGDPEMREGNSGAKFRDGDTLFARITPCLENGKTGLVRNLSPFGDVGFGSTEFIVMRGERVGPAFTYCLARLPSFRLAAQQSMSGASGRQRAKTESVASFSLALPVDDDLLVKFEKIAGPMLDLVGKLGSANRRLLQARDLLLPRLMTGQLSLAKAGAELEAHRELEIA